MGMVKSRFTGNTKVSPRDVQVKTVQPAPPPLSPEEKCTKILGDLSTSIDHFAKELSHLHFEVVNTIKMYNEQSKSTTFESAENPEEPEPSNNLHDNEDNTNNTTDDEEKESVEDHVNNDDELDEKEEFCSVDEIEGIKVDKKTSAKLQYHVATKQEILMQKLLSTDAITVPTDDLRLQRKEIVKRIQQLQLRLDTLSKVIQRATMEEENNVSEEATGTDVNAEADPGADVGADPGADAGTDTDTDVRADADTDGEGAGADEDVADADAPDTNVDGEDSIENTAVDDLTENVPDSDERTNGINISLENDE